jgi:RTX calcium-binding nonapeptide repeat (4 copies)
MTTVTARPPTNGLRSRRVRRAPLFATLALLSAAALVLTGGAVPAAADNTSPAWTCSGSGLRAQLGDALRAEPVTANKNSKIGENPDRAQCVDDDGILPHLTIGDPAAIFVEANELFARTDVTCTGSGCESSEVGPAHLESAYATAGTVNPITAQIGGDAGIIVTTNDLWTETAGVCKSGVPTLSGVSTVVNVTISLGGTAIPLVPISGEPNQEIDLSPLVRVIANERIEEGTATSADQSLTFRALHVEVLPAPPDVPVIDLVIGESKVDRHGDVCNASGTGGENTGGGNPRPCPPGAEYVIADNLCVIHDNGQTIVVGRPYQGPSGGSVISLRIAKQRYPNSPCVKGPGSKYVIIGTNKNDHITGTNKSDRILLFGGSDNSEGGRGNDCIDGGTGNDTLSGALGRDRLYGFSGNDHLVGGSNADYLSASTGNDTVNTGYGKDTVIGGTGRDYINSSTAGPPSKRIDCGAGPDKLRINRNEKKRWKGCEVVHVIR